MLRNCLFFLLFTLSAGALAQALVVGMAADYPPLVFKDGDRLVGIEPDSALAVGKILNRHTVLREMPFAELIPALQAGKIDIIMSGLSVTAERAELFNFTDPYMQIGQMAIMHKDRVAEFAQPWSIYREGVKIGVERGTTGAAFAERELTEAVIVYIADASTAFDALRSREIDLYIHDAPTSWQLATSQENNDLISLYKPLTDERLAWAVSSDNPQLLVDLNRALNTMKANGTLRYIFNRWIPVTVEVR